MIQTYKKYVYGLRDLYSYKIIRIFLIETKKKNSNNIF